jgi:hypothetical protein
MMQPVFHLAFPEVDLSASVRDQMLATIEAESADWPTALIEFAKSIIYNLAPLVTVTAGTSGKAIVLVSGNMSGQIQYVVSKLP